MHAGTLSCILLTPDKFLSRFIHTANSKCFVDPSVFHEYKCFHLTQRWNSFTINRFYLSCPHSRLPRMAVMNVPIRLVTFLLLLTSVLAQQCWKNTTCSGLTDTAFPRLWQANFFALSSRTVSPATMLSASGDFISKFPGNSRLPWNSSQLVFDFGIEVGGLITLKYSTTGQGSIGLAFTESKNWIGEWSDSSNGSFKGSDGVIYFVFNSAGTYSYIIPDLHLWGGFRYLTLFLLAKCTATADIKDIKLEIGFQSNRLNLKAYQGYFHSSDELLNRI